MTHRVRFDPVAAADLLRIHDDVLRRSRHPETAARYILRIVTACRKLTNFPERGTRRDDIRPGLRTIGFERRVTIAFTVRTSEVIVLGILYGGRDLDSLKRG